MKSDMTLKGIFGSGSSGTVNIKTHDGQDVTFEFSEVNSIDVSHDHVDRELPNRQLRAEYNGTTLTIHGFLKGGPRQHVHKWEVDGMGATLDSEPPHHRLTCECGATACGNVHAGEIHNVRENVMQRKAW
jgi:hypothetical protein